jgi:hypothetical protein
MADLDLIRQTLAASIAGRTRLARQLSDCAVALQAERARLTLLQAGADADGSNAARQRIAELSVTHTTTAGALSDADEVLRAAIEQLLAPGIALEGDVPLVLLPVRIEVRSSADLASLRVRIYHDALHAEMLDEGVSAPERVAGIAYWKAAWSAADTAAPWPALVATVGSRRAAWVAQALRPTNPGARPGSAPQFPETSERTLRGAMARTLPDRFFVRIEQDGAAPVTAAGHAIPDELPVGLSEHGDITPLELDDQDLPPIDASLRWLIDFDEAKRVGMALTVPLPLPGQAVRRVVVYGVRSALDRAASAGRMERLIRSHRYTDGAEFLAQGTPTNNTDVIRAEWSRRTPPAPPALDPPPDPDTGSNAAVVARALGVGAASLGLLEGATDRQQARAAAFNTALWTNTWREAIEHLTPAGRANGDQRLDSPSIDEVRDHWVAHVRGRGPLPVLRLGRQPYGLLPVVATDAAWQPLRGGFVENRLVPFIDQHVRQLWKAALADARSVMSGPLDQTLPLILGTDAVLQGLRVRTALAPEPFLGTASALTLPDLGNIASGQEATRALLLISGVAEDAIVDGDVLGTNTRSLALPLVHDSDIAFLTGLLQPVPPVLHAKSVLQVLLAHAWEADRHARDSVAGADSYAVLREAILSNTAGIDRGLLSRAFDVVSAPGFDTGNAGAAHTIVGEAARHVEATVGALDWRALADRNPLPAVAPATLIQQVGGAEVQRDRLNGVAGMQLVGELFRRKTWSAEVRAALLEIAAIISPDERRLLLCETLDCCSHRLDAWLTSAASRRLSDQRDLGGAGIFIGAYGWIENVTLSAPEDAGQIDGQPALHARDDGGYIHAPGIDHAVTAGILRSARLTHRRGDPNSDALDIDLSSARMRDAAAVLDGMRQGQSLGALLGYRLERALHEQSGAGVELDRFIYVLRGLAPLRGGKLTEPGQPVEESVAASDVVDGLRLLAIPADTVRLKLDQGPADTTYMQPPDTWRPPQGNEADAVLAAIAALERTHDAVADLLLAESVYQLALGNPARAAAALDVLGAGEATPPEPEVIRTPRSGLPIQHRLAILVPEPTPASLPGWNADAPRARAEPRLERWAQGALGDATAIVVSADGRRMLADASLCALDVLYDADGDAVASSSLAARLRSRLEGLVDADLVVIGHLWELAGMLRAVLTGARPLGVADVGRPVGEGDRGRVVDADELLARAFAAVAALTAAAAAGFTLQEMAQFGLRAPPGHPMFPATATEQQLAHDALVAIANQRLANAQGLLDRVTGESTAAARVEFAAEALSTVFGGSFVTVPRIFPPAPGETDLWSGAVGPGGVTARPGAHIRPWLQRTGGFRKPTYAYMETVLVREASGQAPWLRVAQAPAGAFGRWAALPFEGDPPGVPLASMVAEVVGVDAAGAEPSLAGAIAGLVLDEWTEVVPRRLKKTDRAHPEAPPAYSDVVSSAVAVNANGPGARPPQAILLALSADGAAWTDERLVKVLDEAFELAKMRTLTLQQIPLIGRMLPALYFRDWSLQGEPVIDWAKVASNFDLNEVLKHLVVKD